MFTDLSQDALRQIQLHLKPRHLFKLLVSCKSIHKMLDKNIAYWERVACHLVWRAEITYCPTFDRPTRYFFMTNLPEGYKNAMDNFMRLVEREYREIRHSSGGRSVTQPARAKIAMDIDCRFDEDCYACAGRYSSLDIVSLSHKQICKREIDGIKILRNQKGEQGILEANMQTWINALDDTDLAMEKKGELMRLLSNCLKIAGPASDEISKRLNLRTLSNIILAFDDKAVDRNEKRKRIPAADATGGAEI